MKALTAALAATAVLLSACDAPVAPHAPLVDSPSFDHGSYGSRIAFTSCAWDNMLTGGVACGVIIPRADGSGSTEVLGAQGPSWAPEATKVAADSGGDILVVTVADGHTVNLTNHPAWEHSAAWSPDGARIAFVSDRDGETALYLMSARDGSNVTRLTTGVHVVGKPTWSPDGVQLAFTCEVAQGNSDVCAVHSDGSGLARLTNDPGCDCDPDWAPDGARIERWLLDAGRMPRCS